MRRQPSIRDELLRTPVEYDPPRRKDNLFLWTVFLLLLLGFTMACWIGSYVIFSRPELPISYKLLRKIHKIDEPQKFKVNAAPPGEFLGPERLYSRYNAMNTPTLREFNRSLERAYLRNYPTNNELVPYVTGRFTIMDAYELRETDFVPSGVVALAVSSDFPKVLIEHVYSASAQDAPIIRRNLQTGRDINLRRTFELTAVLHVTKLNDGRILLTVMPINYGRYEFTDSNGGFELQPPATLNISAGWPIVRGDRLETANQAYVDFRTRSGLGPLAVAKSSPGRTSPAFVGVDQAVAAGPVEPTVAVAPTPGSSAPPALAAVRPSESGGKKLPATAASPGPSASPASTLVARNDVPVLPAIPVNQPPQRPAATPALALNAAPPNQPQRSGVSIQPFLEPTPRPAVQEPTVRPAVPVAGTLPRPATWTMYAPGRVPEGRNVRVNEVAALGSRGTPNEPLYLVGQFRVSAVGESRAKGTRTAVLRSGLDSNVRVIIEYPGDRSTPAEGSELTRDGQRPYQITDVRRADGQINVFAREITDPAQ